ncbi:EXOC6 [Acanthosepion pharaonis]|uniref:EXOC6 n=1 Tax=Acanthosepion pharaonis TaxID=158019 RepID=A0A812C068_ACAPH|nr:EXOC6 [Sepia pharaonis]
MDDQALVKDAELVREEAINAHHDHLITEIESADGPLATTLRAVYDGDDLDKFMQRLDCRIKNHDKEIERMCNHHYQGFIDSVRELLQVSNDAAKLKEEIQTTNDALQKSCAPLLAKGEELIQCRRIQKNIASAIEKQLEHTYLPRVSSHWFSQTMGDAIPKLRESIKDASMSDLKDFLENIRKHSARIGEVAMRHAAEQNNIDPSIAKQRRRRRRAPPPPNPFTGEVEIQEEPEPDQVDEEGARETFETYYRKQRRKQARLSLNPPSNMYESLDAYKLYFHDVVGHTEIDDMIRKSTNLLLTRTLSACLSTLIKKPSLSLLQLIQISINMNNLENSCSSLEEYISNITGAEKDSIHVAKLLGTSMFKDARSEAEEHIYKQLNVKIDEFLDLALPSLGMVNREQTTISNYDWMLTESKGHASGYLMDLIAFLQSTFMSFTNLPEKVARTACMSACKHIASSLMDFVLDNDVKQITMGALQQFNLDLIQCEQFAASEPVPGFNDGTLLLAFADLRQLLDLFLNWDWSAYLADYGQAKCKYVRVKPDVAISLLEKLNSGDKKKFVFASLKKNERDKKKLLDTVLKQLKGLVNGTAPQQGSGQ